MFTMPLSHMHASHKIKELILSKHNPVSLLQQFKKRQNKNLCIFYFLLFSRTVTDPLLSARLILLNESKSTTKV